MNLKNKTVLVTGSSSGIGRAIAVECAKNDATVLIHYRKNKAGAQETLKETSKYSTGAIYQADLTKQTEIAKLFSEIKKTHKAIDILVNNAGEYKQGKFNDLSIWNDQMNNIFMSSLWTTLEFLEFPSTATIRKIINISSVYGLSEMEDPNAPQYSAAKASMNSFTQSLAKILAPKILINAVAPGYTMTPGWDGTPEEAMKTSAEETKIKRFVQPEEIATVVVELTKNDAITGEIIRVDGGLHLYWPV